MMQKCRTALPYHPCVQKERRAVQIEPALAQDAYGVETEMARN
jgi:hypothetical protein